LSAVEHELVLAARARRARRPERAELHAALLTATTFLLAASAFAALGVSHRGLSAGPAAFLICGFALLTQLELETGSGSAVPTQLVFVPMLFVLPLPLVPLCVCIGYLLGGALDAVRGHVDARRALANIGCSWFSLAPAIVLLYLDHEHAPDSRRWSIYVAAFAAQCGSDLAHSLVHQRVAHGIRPAQLVTPLLRVYLVDAMLAPVAFLAADGAKAEPVRLLALVPLAGVLWLLVRERRTRITSELKAARLETLAYSDPLTGLANRRLFEIHLAAQLERVTPLPVSVCILDLDHFKAYNDRHGHLAGDRLLRTAAEAWSAAVRPGDVVARIGGEEFAILLPGCAGDDAETIATRLLESTPGPASCSAGLAAWDGREGATELLARADAALYAAKRNGRGRLIAA
jgi:diguanylate cyclase (GGDEF)-like protein